MKGEFAVSRVLLGIQSRSKHEGAPTHLKVKMEKNGRRFKKKLPIGELPLRFHFPVFTRAGYIEERPKLGIMTIKTESFSGRYGTITAGPSEEDVLRKHGANVIEWKRRVDDTTFAKMVAKIAYSQAAAMGLLDRIRKPSPLVPSMLGLDKFIGHWFGSSEEPYLKIPGEVHVVKVTEDTDLGLLLGEVQLFCNYGMPRYEVVLGELEC